MEAPHQLRTAADEDEAVTIARRDYDGATVIAVDFGGGTDVELDVVGDTAIVVAGDRQFEFDVPPEATDVSVNGGVLSIRA